MTRINGKETQWLSTFVFYYHYCLYNYKGSSTIEDWLSWSKWTFSRKHMMTLKIQVRFVSLSSTRRNEDGLGLVAKLKPCQLPGVPYLSLLLCDWTTVKSKTRSTASFNYFSVFQSELNDLRQCPDSQYYPEKDALRAPYQQFTFK